MTVVSLASRRYTYTHDDQEGSLRVIDAHHIFVQQNTARGFLLCLIILLLLADTFFLILIKEKPGIHFFWSNLVAVIAIKSVHSKSIKKESVVIMPGLGVQLEKHFGSVATISANLNSIPMLNGTNFKDWKENILIVLGCMDLDLALRLKRSTSRSAAEKTNFEKWERSNRMSLMIIKCGITLAFRGAVTDEVTDAIEFIAEIEKRFAKNDKAETNIYLVRLITMKYASKGNIREYIMEIFSCCG